MPTSRRIPVPLVLAFLCAQSLGRAQQAEQPLTVNQMPRVAEIVPNYTPPCAPLDLRFLDGSPLDLTGFWRANDGGMYSVRQVGRCLWWAGLDYSGGLRAGLTFSNVFRGAISIDSDSPTNGGGATVVGNWADVPRGMARGTRILTLAVNVWQDGGQNVVNDVDPQPTRAIEVGVLPELTTAELRRLFSLGTSAKAPFLGVSRTRSIFHRVSQFERVPATF